MQKLCCVRTRQHPLPVWSHNLSLTNLLISPSILNHFWWELYQKVTRFLCTRRQRSTIVETRAQRARRAPAALPPQGNMNQGQAATPAQPAAAAPPAQPAAAAVPPVLPAPLAPLPVPPAPPAFALGPGRSHAIFNFDDPNTGATATKLYNKAIAPLDAKFDGEADNLAVFLASVCD